MSTHIFSEDQRDCLQEIVNVAIGKAGDSLARFLGKFVNLSVPKIRVFQMEEVPEALYELVGREETVVAVSQMFSVPESDLEGEGVVLYTDKTFHELVALLNNNAPEDAQVNESLLLETTNIINGMCLSVVAEQMGLSIENADPYIIGYNVNTRTLVSQEKIQCPEVLIVEINYTLEQGHFRCNWLLLMPGKALEVLKQAIDRLLEDL